MLKARLVTPIPPTHLRHAGVLRPYTVSYVPSLNQVFLTGQGERRALITFTPGPGQLANLQSLADQARSLAAAIAQHRRQLPQKWELICERTKSRYHLLFDRKNLWLLEDIAIFFAGLIEKFTSQAELNSGEERNG